MEGKTIKQTAGIGFVEYDIDKRISFIVLGVLDFNIGDVVSFDIGTKRIHNSDTEFEVAIDLSLLRKKKNLSEKVFRISKVARSFNCSIPSIVEILKNNGFDVESRSLKLIFITMLKVTLFFICRYCSSAMLSYSRPCENFQGRRCYSSLISFRGPQPSFTWL